MAVPSRAWFLLSVLPLIAGGGFVARSCVAMQHEVESMTRVVVPGEADVWLDKGEWVFYGETESEVGGHEYDSGSFTVSCSLTEGDGTAMDLEGPSGHTTYTLFGYHGESMYEATVPADGYYHFACRGSDAPAVIAIGRGIGSSIVTLVLASIGTAFGLVAVIVFVAIWRSRRMPKPEPVTFSPYGPYA
jgi:hypothetical protein